MFFHFPPEIASPWARLPASADPPEGGPGGSQPFVLMGSVDWLMKSQTSLGRMSSPIVKNLIPTKTFCSPKIQPKKTQQRYATTLIDKNPAVFLRKCLIVLQRSGKKSEVLDLFAQRLRKTRSLPILLHHVTPGSSQTSKRNSSCHAAGVILWFCDTNPNMALLGGNPLICLTFELFLIPKKILGGI